MVRFHIPRIFASPSSAPPQTAAARAPAVKPAADLLAALRDYLPRIRNMSHFMAHVHVFSRYAGVCAPARTPQPVRRDVDPFWSTGSNAFLKPPAARAPAADRCSPPLSTPRSRPEAHNQAIG